MKRSSSRGAVVANSHTRCSVRGYFAPILFGRRGRTFVERHLAVALEVYERGMAATITAVAQCPAPRASTSI